mgnify:CR=1 FL=1
MNFCIEPLDRFCGQVTFSVSGNQIHHLYLPLYSEFPELIHFDLYYLWYYDVNSRYDNFPYGAIFYSVKDSQPEILHVLEEESVLKATRFSDPDSQGSFRDMLSMVNDVANLLYHKRAQQFIIDQIQHRELGVLSINDCSWINQLVPYSDIRYMSTLGYSTYRDHLDLNRAQSQVISGLNNWISELPVDIITHDWRIYTLQ